MASYNTWGNSWGTSWGNSWTRTTGAGIVFQPGSKGKKEAEFWRAEEPFEKRPTYEIEILLLNS